MSFPLGPVPVIWLRCQGLYQKEINSLVERVNKEERESELNTWNIPNAVLSTSIFLSLVSVSSSTDQGERGLGTDITMVNARWIL